MREKIIDINIYRRSVAFMLGTEDEIASRLAELKAYDLAGRVNEMDWDNTLALTLCDGSDRVARRGEWRAKKSTRVRLW